jgi:hypothetical protein
MKPYFYIIQHKPTGKLYAGSQYGKNSHFKNLLVTYFTSSKSVNELMIKDGVESFDIIIVEERPDAREYEQKYLMEKYSNLGRSVFMSEYLNRNLSPGILLTEESIKKANGPEKRRKCSESSKRLFVEGRHNFQLGVNPSKLVENRKKSSERMKGNTYGANRNMTEELRNVLAEKSKGNTNVRGTVWVINKEGKKKRVQPNQIPNGFNLMRKIND